VLPGVNWVDVVFRPFLSLSGVVTAVPGVELRQDHAGIFPEGCPSNSDIGYCTASPAVHVANLAPAGSQNIRIDPDRSHGPNTSVIVWFCQASRQNDRNEQFL
jgi:hypothetical protein